MGGDNTIQKAEEKKVKLLKGKTKFSLFLDIFHRQTGKGKLNSPAILKSETHF